MTNNTNQSPLVATSLVEPSLIQRLTCDYVKELTPYESARRLFSGGNYWLNANESPFANSYQLDDSQFNRYPSCQPDAVINAYAKYANLTPEQVLVSRGADEGIELVIRAFCTPGKDSVLICPPTYGMYAISAQTFNVGVQKVPLLEDFGLDLKALEKVAQSDVLPKVIFLCSPNNPTGTRLPQQQITTILDMFAGKSLVVVDEAYIEFDIDNNQTALLQRYDNAIVLRTLSKAFALAGIRCGFTLASAEIIEVLMKVIAPYPVSDPVAQIAASALSPEGIQTMQSQVSFLQQEQQWLITQLQSQTDMQLVGAQFANFILYRLSQKQSLMDYLVANGLLIRDQSKQLYLQGCLRITVGNREENQKLVALFQQFYQEGKAA